MLAMSVFKFVSCCLSVVLGAQVVVARDIVVDLRNLKTGIGLRDRHAKEGALVQVAMPTCTRCEFASYHQTPEEYNLLQQKEVDMDNVNKTERHYRVVRYYNDFGIGVLEDVLGTHLTMAEAEKIAKDNPPIVSDEEVAIEEEESSAV